MAEIRRKIIKQGKRNVISRHIHARNDKEKIVSWRTDLNRILHVFSVRSIGSVWRSLTLHSQTELGIDTHVIGSDTRVIVTGTQVTVSGPEHNVTNTHTMVSEIHRTAVKGQEGRGGKNPSVSDTHPLSIAKWRSPLHRLKLGQQSKLPIYTPSYILIQYTWRVPASTPKVLLWTRRVD